MQGRSNAVTQYPADPDGLSAGMDFRQRQHRRTVFLRFFDFHLRYRSHPGGVYYALPYLAEALSWDGEQRAWAAFLNGNTQNPVTTLALMEASGHTPRKAGAMLRYYQEHYPDLEWDTDRRHHKSHFPAAVDSYLHLTGGGYQLRYWTTGGWAGAWRKATAIHSMGRLSAWSYLEYLRVLGVLPHLDADTLLLGDRAGSRSHRNGLCLVLGLDDWIWWDKNPGFTGVYPPDLLRGLETEGARLLREAQKVNPAATNLTLESALCTYKSWHRPNRRYPGVYNDLLYRRLKRAETRLGNRFGLLWDARRDSLPAELLLERNPYDPGPVPAKQNHYLTTGEAIVMDLDWACFSNGFAAGVARGAYGTRKD